MNGWYYEDCENGRTLTTQKRTITETDFIICRNMMGFFEPLFLDSAFVEKQTGYEKQVIPGAMTFAFAEGLMIMTGILNGTGMAFLGADFINIKNPTYVGDTVYVEIQIINKRRCTNVSKGIVTFDHLVYVGNVVVMEYRVKRMMKRIPE